MLFDVLPTVSFVSCVDDDDDDDEEEEEEEEEEERRGATVSRGPWIRSDSCDCESNTMGLLATEPALRASDVRSRLFQGTLHTGTQFASLRAGVYDWVSI